MLPPKPAGTLATNAVGTAGWLMIGLGAITIASCEIRSKTFEGCAAARSEGAAWLMGGIGTRTGLNTMNPHLRAKRPEDEDGEVLIRHRGPDGRFLSEDPLDTH